MFKKGSKHCQWKGGRVKNGLGYILVLKSKHPFPNHKAGYVLEHRLIIEKQIGRYLQKGEIGHHINGIVDDNRPKNLMAFVNKSAHQRFEKGSIVQPEEIVFDGRKL